MALQQHFDFENWKDTTHITKLVFSRDHGGRLKKIGNGLTGKVYAGKVKFTDGKSHRVAIKVFELPLNDEMAAKYQKVIRDFSKVGVRIPKMAMHLHDEHGWVQVSQLFISKGRSKLVNKLIGNITEPRAREEAVHQWALMAKAGYYPSIDAMEPFIDHSKGILPIDLGSIVLHTPDGYLPLEAAVHLLNVVEQTATSNEEKEHLLKIAFQHAGRKVGSHMHEVINSRKTATRKP